MYYYYYYRPHIEKLTKVLFSQLGNFSLDPHFKSLAVTQVVDSPCVAYWFAMGFFSIKSDCCGTDTGSGGTGAMPLKTAALEGCTRPQSLKLLSSPASNASPVPLIRRRLKACAVQRQYSILRHTSVGCSGDIARTSELPIAAASRELRKFFRSFASMPQGSTKHYRVDPHPENTSKDAAVDQ